MAILTSATVCKFALSILVTHHTVDRSIVTEYTSSFCFSFWCYLWLACCTSEYAIPTSVFKCWRLHVTITPDISATDDHPSGCAITVPKSDGANQSALHRFPFCT